MVRTTVHVVFAACVALLGAQFVHARGFGGAHPSGGYHGSSGGYHGGSSGGYHQSGYSAGHEYSSGSGGSEAMRGGTSYHSYEGPHGTSVEHGTAAVQGAAVGPGGAAAGGKAVSGTEVTGAGGNTYTHESSAGRGAAAGPGGAEAGHYGQTGGAYHGADGGYYAHGTAGYGAAHAALPTDAGFGMPAAGAGAAAYAGNHQTEALSGSAYAARAAAVRSGYSGAGLYGQGWYGAHPGAWTPAAWTAGQAWGATAWPALGVGLGWDAAAQPIAYNYGNDVTYQDGQVYYGSQPVATAEQYYQQAANLAQTAAAPDPQSSDWMPLGVFALVHKEDADPHYVIQLAVNKSGVVGGNYTDRISDTTVPVQGAVDRKTQRVAWTVGNNKTTVAETGVYNLTQDEAPLLIHMGSDRTQQWLLVRLKQPQ